MVSLVYDVTKVEVQALVELLAADCVSRICYVKIPHPHVFDVLMVRVNLHC